MNTESVVTLGQLIERFLIPIKGREAQVELIRFMTRGLKMGPDSVPNFPRIDKVIDEIKKRLCVQLLQVVQLEPGHQLIYRSRGGPPKGLGWLAPKAYTLARVNHQTLTLDDGQRVNSQAVPLYCPELLAKVDAHVDFDELNRKAFEVWV